MTNTERARRIAEIERELAELRASLPAHSIKPAMLLRIEALEEELASLTTPDNTEGIAQA
jgi:hypothetical protein